MYTMWQLPAKRQTTPDNKRTYPKIKIKLTVMAKLKVIILIAALIFCNTVNTFGNTDDPVLLTVNGREVTLSEFKYTFNKNNLPSQAIEQKSVEEYLELFINFHLKVHDALQMGLDTHATFVAELAGYRNQLAQRYLSDQDVLNKLFEEAVSRMKYDIRASHILISIDEHAPPADTIAAWNAINKIRERALAGENFGELAKKYSNDPSAAGMPATEQRPAIPPNYGDLGYFTLLEMVYPFETIAFQTPLNQISKPVRTSFGYHIVKVTDRLPAMGFARIAHFMVREPANASKAQLDSIERRINEIYYQIRGGRSFEELAKLYSDDKSSAQRGGEMPPFKSSQMLPEFIKAISKLHEPSSISPPLRTQFGWHIIKLIEKQGPDTSANSLTHLRNTISRDARAELSEDVIVSRIKSETGFIENRQHLKPFYDLVDNSIFQGKWEFEDNFNPENILFQFSDIKVTQSDFGHYLSANQMRSPASIVNHVNSMYESFVTQKLLEFEKSMLEKRNPEFRNIIREYHDGMLLFELTNKKVWSRAVEDTLGLNEFFTENLSNYMWDKRVDGIIYAFPNKDIAEKSRKRLRTIHRKALPHDEFVSELNADSQIKVSAEKGLFEISKKPLLKELKLRRGVSRVIEWNEKYYIVQINSVIAPEAKKLEEVRGRVIADYQNYLDDRWIKELRNKYSYTVNKDVLKLLTVE